MIRASESWRWMGGVVAWLGALALVFLLGAVGAVADAAGGCNDVVVNGGFENGSADMSPWVPSGHAYVSEVWAHEGDFGLWMGGYPDALATVHQTVNLTGGGSTATLTYWWNMHSLDGSQVATDRLVVSLRTEEGEPLVELETLDNTGERGIWVQSTFDVGSYAGMDVQIHFGCTGDEQMVTSFFLDDIALEVCAEVGTATPTATPTATLEERVLRYLPLVLAE